ncbi:MAG: hypothetical protein RJB66_2246 [Pseudomonadota bacterium]|jgi:uncharacterized protein (TIGR02722 family)
MQHSVYKQIIFSSVIALIGFVIGCGPSAFVKGKYDDNVERTNLMTDEWSESDMQETVKSMVASLVTHPVVTGARTRPVVMVTQLQNKTSEHIDTQSIMDMVRVELMKTGKMAFVDKEAREDIDQEYNYQNSGRVSETTKKGPGAQTGADFIVNGRLDSIVQEAGKEKSVYYKITLNLTSIKSGVIEWTDQKQIRKLYKKKTLGL